MNLLKEEKDRDRQIELNPVPAYLLVLHTACYISVTLRPACCIDALSYAVNGVWVGEC
jgi:hypothetical protein